MRLTDMGLNLLPYTPQREADGGILCAGRVMANHHLLAIRAIRVPGLGVKDPSQHRKVLLTVYIGIDWSQAKREASHGDASA